MLATDGDFNVGVTSQTNCRLIEQKPQAASFCRCSASAWATSKIRRWKNSPTKAMGTTPTSTLDEARKVLVEARTATLVTIAKDVKIQVEFNPRCAPIA